MKGNIRKGVSIMNTYTIRELSEMFHLPASTLRYYEDAGILTNVGRTAGNQRIYYDMHVNRLRSLCCFKRTGMSISQLQQLYRYEENETQYIDSIVELLDNHKEQVIAQIRDLEKDLEHVKRKLAYYTDIQSSLETGIPLPEWENYKHRTF